MAIEPKDTEYEDNDDVEGYEDYLDENGNVDLTKL